MSAAGDKSLNLQPLPLRVLVVDDSSFFRSRVSRLLAADPAFDVVGFAVNGREAVSMAAKLAPDVITMDVEMPVMDGITAVRMIMQAQPTTILMLSSLTRLGAEATFQALDAGALDFVPKEGAGTGAPTPAFGDQLISRIKAVARSGARAPVFATARRSTAWPSWGEVAEPVACVVIGASTGGPPLVSTILQALPADFDAAIVIAQHMPATFTSCYAERSNRSAALTVKLAEDGEALRKGVAYIAPGGMQTGFRRNGDATVELTVTPGMAATRFKPSIDACLSTAAASFGASVLAVVLTGMGDDGCVGARAIKVAGGRVWAQDEMSSAVFGMPRAVIEAGLADSIVSAGDLAERLRRHL